MNTGIIRCVKSALPLVIVGTCLALVCGLSACGSEEASSEDLTESPCAPAGTPIECTCVDGSAGSSSCLDDGTLSPCVCESADAAGGETFSVDGSEPADAEEEVALAWGDRECEYTSQSFAAGEWSPGGTTTLTFNVAEVEGGFALSGYNQDSPFASCEVVFDLDGETATFREPQPCQDGVAQYESGAAIVSGPDFSFDVMGKAFGMPISLKVDCGAGPLPLPEDQREPTEGFLGNWNCEGTSFAAPVNFTLNNASTGDASFESTFEPVSEMDFLVKLLMNCKVMWMEEDDSHASIDPESYCAGAAETTVESDTGLNLSDGILSGSFYTVALEETQSSYAFTCER